MWTLDAGAALPLWQLSPPDSRSVLAFSTRRGGVSSPPYDSLNLGRSVPDRPSAVHENRRRALHALGLDLEHLATAGQVHGAATATVRAPGHSPDHDALVTTVRGVALAVTTADCMSILYAAPDAVGVAHSGWRGTAAGMPRAALQALCAAAAVTPAAVTVHFGPCIRACCYQIGIEVARRFPVAAVFRHGERRMLDLVAAARLQLLDAGVPEPSIADTGACTACDPGWYFSHRRDHGVAGRQWALAALRR